MGLTLLDLKNSIDSKKNPLKSLKKAVWLWRILPRHKPLRSCVCPRAVRQAQLSASSVPGPAACDSSVTVWGQPRGSAQQPSQPGGNAQLSFYFVLGRRERTEPAWLAEQGSTEQTFHCCPKCPRMRGWRQPPAPILQPWGGCAHSGASLGAQTVPSQVCPLTPLLQLQPCPNPTEPLCPCPSQPSPLLPHKAPLAPNTAPVLLLLMGVWGFLFGVSPK